MINLLNILSGKLQKKLKMSDPQSHSIKMENGNWSRSNQHKADLFSEHLVKTFKIPTI